MTPVINSNNGTKMTFQVTNRVNYEELRPCCQSLEKHLYFPGEHFLIIMMGVQYKGLYLEQLKLLPEVNTSYFARPRVDVSPCFNGPKANKQT